jgi:hypothetical protein
MQNKTVCKKSVIYLDNPIGAPTETPRPLTRLDYHKTFSQIKGKYILFSNSLSV